MAGELIRLANTGFQTFSSTRRNSEEVSRPEKGKQKEVTIGPLFTIRSLPSELKNRILRLAHPKQSVTALHATLFERGFMEKRWQNGVEVTLESVIQECGPPGKMTITDMARMIARSPRPNTMRDLIASNFNASSPELDSNATLVSRLPGRSEAARERERRQARELLKTDFDWLTHFGEGAEEDGSLLERIETELEKHSSTFKALVPNAQTPWLGTLPFAAIMSPVADALVLGLSARLNKLKSNPQDAVRLLQVQITGYGHLLEGVPDRPSPETIYAVLCDMLRSFGVLQGSSRAQKTILQSFSILLTNKRENMGLRLERMTDATIVFGKALSGFCQSGEASKEGVAQEALKLFRKIITGQELGSKGRPLFSVSSRVRIMGEVASSLESTSPLPVTGEIMDKGMMQKARSLFDKSKVIISKRPSTDSAILTYILEALQLPSVVLHERYLGLLVAAENVDAWRGLFSAVPRLSESDQRKLGKAFLKQMAKINISEAMAPGLLDRAVVERYGDVWSYPGNLLMNAATPEEARTNVRRLRGFFLPGYQALSQALPSIKDSDLAKELKNDLDRFKQLLSVQERNNHFPEEANA